MNLTKLGYFAEFLIFPPLVLISTALAFLGSSPPHPITWMVVCGLGLAAWTLIEYWLHRVVFHHAPFLSRLHEQHHDHPQALLGTPVWASVSLGLIVVAGLSWTLLGFNLATAATAGMATGYLWYVFVHHTTHHWQPRHGSYLYRVRLRHAQHHYSSGSGNFGVTTDMWDFVFGTALERRRPARRSGQ